MTVRTSTTYDRRPGHAHRQIREVGPPRVKWHDHAGFGQHVYGYSGHRHAGGKRGRWDYVSDVRFCPGCQGPAVELLRGKDAEGRFEIWACVDACGRAEPWPTPRQTRDRWRLFRLRRDDERRPVDSWTVLRDGDYDGAALARVRTRAVVS